MCQRVREQGGGGEGVIERGREIQRERDTERNTHPEEDLAICWNGFKKMFSSGNSGEGHGLGILNLFLLGNFHTTQLQPGSQSPIKSIQRWGGMRWAVFLSLQIPIL